MTVFSYGNYEGNLRKSIIAYKNGSRSLAKLYAKELIAFSIKKELNLFDNTILIPIPSSKKRIKERGYCQIQSLTNEIQNITSNKPSEKVLIRVKDTKYMNDLKNLKERRINISKAFIALPRINHYKRAILIDDILTSGSTMREAAKEIRKKNGNIKLIGLTIASGDKWN